MKFVTGGQIGVDRAALDAAILSGIEHGGWCPKGRIAADGRIPDYYHLQETEEASYEVRTKRNINDSDGTLLIFSSSVAPISGGSKMTIDYANEINKPCFIWDLDLNEDLDDLTKWVNDNQIKILNIAGPRETTSPGIYDKSKSFLIEFIKHLNIPDQNIRELKNKSITDRFCSVS